ncbi:hypothetical protein KY290_014658 [Solanum tuberosum]|uniref:Uncharacterized protein n=1 Tax=Solanum tuberosum TaxID=4113 RepID=A0ABQ7VQA5_SOLTU|nr:hypothetical protein KY289_014700 [Solanum tuberosum]KAH0770677.1 hypothetical protein KY290_014658 [Solanum tuberosum]
MQGSMFWTWFQTHGKMSINSASSPSAIPLSFQKARLNVARMVPMMYIYDENHCLPVLEEHIKSKFCNTDGESRYH